jgi:hypothetical protein
MTLRLMLSSPTTVMTARVNQGSFTYPLHTVTMDAVDGPSGGSSWQDVKAEMTVIFGTAAGLDDLGRQRVRTSPPDAVTLNIGRSSQGARDGEVDLADDAYITVLNDFRAWSQIPDIDATTDPPTIYKDATLAAGSLVATPPPIANCGVPMIGTVDSGTSKLRVTLPHESQTSFPVADGAALTTYTWRIPAAATVVRTEGPAGETADGSGDVDAERITVDVTAGLHYFRLNVTDDNANQHRAWVPVYAYQSGGTGEEMNIESFEILGRTRTPQGQRLRIRITEDVDKDTFPDGTLVMLWDGEPANEADRSHLLFWGWHQGDPAQIRSERTGIVKNVTFDCVDIAGRLAVLPGFPFVVGSDSGNFSGWSYMANAHWFRFMAYLLNWHSNAFIVADWKPDTSDLASYDFVVRTADGGDLYDQMNQQALALVPDNHFTCNRLGQLLTVVDPMLQDSGDRTATVQTTLDEDDWSNIEYTAQFWPRFHWLRENAMYAHTTTLSGFFSIAPGESPGMGEGSKPQGEQLAKTQAALNASCGHRYERLNAKLSPFRITLADGNDRDIEPADMTWINLTLSSAYAAQRNLNFTAARGLPLAVEYTYNHARTGTTVQIVVTWERETEGIPGVTYTPPSA